MGTRPVRPPIPAFLLSSLINPLTERRFPGRLQCAGRPVSLAAAMDVPDSDKCFIFFPNAVFKLVPIERPTLILQMITGLPEFDFDCVWQGFRDSKHHHPFLFG